MPDPQAPGLALEIDGERVQQGSTPTMVFSVARIVSERSRLMTLHPGDAVATGTPAGLGREPPRSLRPGDVTEARVEGLGGQHRTIRARA